MPEDEESVHHLSPSGRMRRWESHQKWLHVPYKAERIHEVGDSDLLYVHSALEHEASLSSYAVASKRGHDVVLLEHLQRLAHLLQDALAPISRALRGKVVPQIKWIFHIPLILLRGTLKVGLRREALTQGSPYGHSMGLPVEGQGVKLKESPEKRLSTLRVLRSGNQVDVSPKAAVPRDLPAPPPVPHHDGLTASIVRSRKVLKIRYNRGLRVHQVEDRKKGIGVGIQVPVAAADELPTLCPLLHVSADLADSLVQTAIGRNQLAVLVPQKVPHTQVHLNTAGVHCFDQGNEGLEYCDDALEAVVGQLVGEALEHPNGRLIRVFLRWHVREITVRASCAEAVHVRPVRDDVAGEPECIAGVPDPGHYRHDGARALGGRLNGVAPGLAQHVGAPALPRWRRGGAIPTS
mmetsp:Transcript_39399/g.117963  ORF Transcript_39399/g.117963 Transcript_39399/m.117963 type:complete len:407 (-) Transcript_39399:231-1451(-)